MAIILLIACSNFICINYGIQKTTVQTKEALYRIDSICMSSPSISNIDGEHSNIDIYLKGIKESLRELESLKKGIFDSNTITFLSSFVLVFLGGILFDIEKRTKDKLAKSKEIIEKLEIELHQIKIAKQTNAMSILSKYLQLQLSSTKYEINDDIVNIANELFKSFEKLQALLRDKDTRFITKDAQKEYTSLLNEIKMLLDKEDIHTHEKNKDKLNYIYECQKLLDNCMKDIEKFKTEGRIV